MIDVLTFILYIFLLINFYIACVSEWKLLSHVWLFVTPWAIQSMVFSRPEYWSEYEEPGGLQSMGSQRVGHDWAHVHTHTALAGRLLTIAPTAKSSSFSQKGINLILESPPSWPHLNLTAFQRPHLLMLSHYGSWLRFTNLGRGTVHSSSQWHLTPDNLVLSHPLPLECRLDLVTCFE